MTETRHFWRCCHQLAQRAKSDDSTLKSLNANFILGDCHRLAAKSNFQIEGGYRYLSIYLSISLSLSLSYDDSCNMANISTTYVYFGDDDMVMTARQSTLARLVSNAGRDTGDRALEG
jgi:hypothetical protein